MAAPMRTISYRHPSRPAPQISLVFSSRPASRLSGDFSNQNGFPDDSIKSFCKSVPVTGPTSILSASVALDSCHRTSADSSNATSVNFRGKSDILDLRNRGQKLLMPRQGQSFLADSCVGQHGFDCPTTLWDSEACRFLLFDMQGRQATEKNAKHANNSKLFPRKP